MRSRMLFLVTLLSVFGCVSLFSVPLKAQAAEPDSAKSENSDAAAPPVDAAKPAADNNDKDAAPEKRKFRFRLGGISVGAGYTHFSGPYYYPYAYPYAPFGYFPGDWVAASYWYPISSLYPYYGPGAFGYGDGRGEVRLMADPKAAEVYIDGGYAGTADKLKSMWLDPGAYDLIVSAGGREPFHQRLYVVSGKSLKITAKLNPEQPKEQP